MSTPTIQLKDVCERIDYGFTASADFSIKEPRLLRITDIQDGDVDWSRVPGCKIRSDEEIGNRLTVGDIVVARTGATTGKSFLIRHTPRAVFASYLIRLRTSSKVLSEYLFAFLQSKIYWAQIARTIRGAAQGGVNATMLGGLRMPLPNLSEQQRILSQLDQADRLRNMRRYALELSGSLLQASFLEIFGDPLSGGNGIYRLDSLLESSPQNGLYVPSEDYSAHNGTGVEMVHMSDLFGGRVVTGDLKRVCIGENDVSKYALDENDLLVARRSLNYEGAAKPCMVPKLSEPLVFESSMIRIRPCRDKILPIYLYYYLSNEVVRSTRVRRYVTVSTISGINQDGLKRIEIMVPPLALQQHFAVIASQFERLQAQQHEAERQAEHLFQTLLQNAFANDI